MYVRIHALTPVYMLQSPMSGRMKVFLGVAFVALVFLGFNAFMRGKFEDRSGIDLPGFALPIKYESGSARGNKTFIAFWTFPAMARDVVGQPVYWAGEGIWSNRKTHVRFHPGRKILRGNELAADRRLDLRDIVVTTWITACELYYGAACSKEPEANREVVTDFLESILVLDLDEASCQIFGELKALLRSEGLTLDDADLMIGSIAAARGATVVTGNVRHFSRIPGIGVESWVR